MKRYNIIMFLFLLQAAFVTSCRKSEEAFIPVEESFLNPEETLTSFKDQIQSSANGWKGFIQSKGGKIYSLYLNLNGDEVTLYIDDNLQSAATPSKSKFSLEVVQGVNPSLIFKSGSSLEYINPGKRQSIDSAYTFNSAQGDTIKLTGNRFGDELKLIKASAEDKAAFSTGKLAASMEILSNYLESVRFLYFQTSSANATQLSLNPQGRNAGSVYVSNNSVISGGTDFAYTPNGIYLRNPLIIDGVAIQELFWDSASGGFYVMSKGVRIDVEESQVPVIPLHYLLGTEFPSLISLPSPVEYAQIPGWSQAFTSLWLSADAAMWNSSYKFILYVADFNMNMQAKTMTLDIYFIRGTSVYLGQFPYTFTKTADGVFKFTAQPLNTSITAQANANVIKTFMKPITDVVAQDRFFIDYYDVPQLGILSQFKSVDRSTIYFTGLFGSLME